MTNRTSRKNLHNSNISMKYIWNQIKQSNYIICIFLTCISILFFTKAYRIVLISPDDVMYKNILSGIITGTPDAHCIFIRYPLALIISCLYKLNSTISWYMLFLLGCNAICLFLILNRVRYINQYKRKVLYLITVFLLFTSILAEHMIHLEWTVTAGIMGSTALFRYITIPCSKNTRQKISEYLICGILLVFSFCIRYSVALMFMPLFVIVFFTKKICVPTTAVHINKSQKKQLLFENIIFFICCIVAFGVITFSHEKAYSTEEWQTYSEYTDDRSTLFDYSGYPDFNSYSDVYTNSGISEEMYDLMSEDYNYLIPYSNYNEVNLEPLADLSSEIYKSNLSEQILSALHLIWNTLSNKDFLIMNIISLSLLVYSCFISYKNKMNMLFICAVLFWFIIFLGYLAMQGRLPARVFNCLYMGFLMPLFGNIFREKIYTHQDAQRIPGNKKTLFVMAYVILFLFSCCKLVNIHSDNADHVALAAAREDLYEYCNNNPDNIYLYDFWSFSQRGELFQNGKESIAANNYVSTGGWIYNSPLYDQMFKNLECTNIIDEINENDNIYYLVNTNRETDVIDRLNRYFMSTDESIYVEKTDSFTTNYETVTVLHFTN